MRLFDRIQRGEFPEKIANDLRDSLVGAKVIVATNVSAWFDENVRSLPVAERLSVIDRCIPPFECQFVEFFKHDGTTVGVGIQRYPADVPGEWKIGAVAFLYDPRADIKIHLIPLVGWLRVDANGTVDWDRFELSDLREGEWKEDPELFEGSYNVLCSNLGVALMTFRFMHCANVVVEERQPARHERRQVEREGGEPLTSYHTLDIGGPVRRLNTEGGLATNGIRKALHICRGHFADYTQGAGLFGKYKVSVFVPDHVRGNAHRGRVIADYRITPPEPVASQSAVNEAGDLS